MEALNVVLFVVLISIPFVVGAYLLKSGIKIIKSVLVFLYAIFLSVYMIALFNTGYKCGQINYYKHGFKYTPVVHKIENTITDTVYIKK